MSDTPRDPTERPSPRTPDPPAAATATSGVLGVGYPEAPARRRRRRGQRPRPGRQPAAGLAPVAARRLATRHPRQRARDGARRGARLRDHRPGAPDLARGPGEPARGRARAHLRRASTRTATGSPTRSAACESSLELLESQSTNEAEAQRAAQRAAGRARHPRRHRHRPRGPGIVLTINDPDSKVDAPIILDTVQELRDAGAEAIQIGDAAGRRRHLVLRHRQRPVGLRAARCARPTSSRPSATRNTLAGAMEIPGGVTATVRRRRRRHRRADRGRGRGRRVAHPDLASVRSARTHHHPLMGPPATRPRSDMSDLEYPAGLRYTAEHEWVRADGDTVRVGITSFAQEALGDVVYVSLPDRRRRGRRRRHVRRGRVDQVGERPLRPGLRRGHRRQRGARRDPRAGELRPLRRGLDVRAARLATRGPWTACWTSRRTPPSSPDILGAGHPAKGGPTTVP